MALGHEKTKANNDEENKNILYMNTTLEIVFIITPAGHCKQTEVPSLTEGSHQFVKL